MNVTEAVRSIVSLRDLALQNSGDSSEEALFLGVCLQHFQQTRSQNLQDLFALFAANMRRGGFFVEFGATDGRSLSNTYFLEHVYGWNGILAEPARHYHRDLRRNRSSLVDTRCVWSETGINLTFIETPNTELSTIDTFSDSDIHSPHRAAGVRYEVETISLNDLLRHYNAPLRIDFMSVDTEGSEFDILSSFDFGKYDVRVFTIEHNWVAHAREKIYQLMTSKGYERRFPEISGWDDWYVRTYC